MIPQQSVLLRIHGVSPKAAHHGSLYTLQSNQNLDKNKLKPIVCSIYQEYLKKLLMLARLQISTSHFNS
jgi:hypothetical protein